MNGGKVKRLHTIFLEFARFYVSMIFIPVAIPLCSLKIALCFAVYVPAKIENVHAQRTFWSTCQSIMFCRKVDPGCTEKICKQKIVTS